MAAEEIQEITVSTFLGASPINVTATNGANVQVTINICQWPEWLNREAVFEIVNKVKK